MRRFASLALVMAWFANAAAKAPPPTVLLYPSVRIEAGLPIVVIDAHNIAKTAQSLCQNPLYCLALEIGPRGGQGPWTAWQQQPLPRTPAPLVATDLVRLAPGASRTLFRLAFAPFGGKPHAFAVGPFHYFPALPARFAYRFSYRVAAPWLDKLKVADLVAGPLGPSSSPNELAVLDDAEIVKAIAAGEIGAAQYVKPGDRALLAQLDPLLGSEQFAVADEAIRAVIATNVPEAAARLFTVLAKRDEIQLRVAAAAGFLKIHPRSIAKQLFEQLARERGGEEGDIVIEQLAKAIGLMDDPSQLPELAKAEARLAPPGKARVEAHSALTTFLLVRARLGDAAAAALLAEHVGPKAAQDDSLGDFVHDLGYAHSWPLAHALLDALTDARQGSRVKPWFDFAAPRNDKQRKAIADMERDANVHLGDDVLWTITHTFPTEAWGFAIDPLRRYAAAEQARVKAVVAKH